MKVQLVLIAFFLSLPVFSGQYFTSIESQDQCKTACEMEVNGQSCIAKGGAFTGPGWLMTEWTGLEETAVIKKLRLTTHTDTWTTFREVKFYVKDETGGVRELILDLGFHRLHDCESMVITLAEPLNIVDLEIFLRGNTKAVDIIADNLH